MINRRTFVSQFAAISGGIAGLTVQGLEFKSTEELAKRTGFSRFVAVINLTASVGLPTQVRIPLRKTAFPVTARSPVTLRFPSLKNKPGTYVLRLTAALDFRDEKTIRVTLAETGELVGTLPCRFSHPYQPFHLPIDRQWLERIGRQGLSLQLVEGKTDAWFLVPQPDMEAFPGLVPQLMVSTEPGTETGFMTNLYSLNAFSPFGWQGGCVIDGLHELARSGDQKALTALTRYLALFLDDQRGVIYENPMTVPIDGTFHSIEDFLPLACIAERMPDHIAVRQATGYLLARKNADGLIISGNATTEGCYTVAYPLAAIAKSTRNAELAQVALDQLTHRLRLLTDQRAIYQRTSLQGVKTYRNWGRGVVWCMLGSVKTLHLLQQAGFSDLKGLETVRQAVATNLGWLADLQTEAGLWYAYVDRPETGVDTSATAGLATAIGWACALRILPDSRLNQSRRAYAGLQPYLTVDGFLTGICQVNRGGEDLQQGGYRVMAQFGMGPAIPTLTITA